jgi:nitrogen fixation/metabolism regulation signal transduction histidine kinase
MKLRNRLFLTLFILAFLPVAAISYFAAEALSGTLNRLASPGVQGALESADSLVQMSIGYMKGDCSRIVEEYRNSGAASALDLDDSQFVIISTDTNEECVGSAVCGEGRPPQLIALIDSTGLSSGNGLVQFDGRLIVYESIQDTSKYQRITAGYVLGESFKDQYSNLGLNLQSFEQLRLLGESSRTFVMGVWLTFTAVYLVLILLVSRLLARTMTRPLAAMSSLVETIGPDNWNVNIQYGRRDEIGSLAAGFNRMSNRLAETTRNLVQAERQAAWQDTARSIAHGIKNVLAPVKLALARLSKESEVIDRKSPVYTIQEELRQLEKTANDFSVYGRPVCANEEKININEIVSQAVSVITQGHPHCRIGTEFVEDLPEITADRNLLRDALVNLIKNGCEAAGEEGQLQIRTQVTDKAVTIEIADNGPGIPTDIRDRVFEPYVSSKAGGTGIGLAIVRKVIESSGGRISFTTGSDGTIFTVQLSRQRDAN